MIESIRQEIEALEKNNTWILVDLLPRKNVVGCPWKYKVDYNIDATINKPKSRLMAEGFTHVEGVDYHESFSPMAKWQTIKIFVH